MKIYRISMKDKSEIKMEDVVIFEKLIESAGYNSTLIVSDKYNFQLIDCDKLITCNECLIKNIIE